MDELVLKSSWGETSSRPVRVRESSLGAGSVLVTHLHYVCLADPAVILQRPSTGMVLCECGSAGWIEP